MKKMILGAILGMLVTSMLFLSVMTKMTEEHVTDIESISEDYKLAIDELIKERQTLKDRIEDLEVNILNKFNGDAYSLRIKDDDGVIHIYESNGKLLGSTHTKIY